MFLKVFVKDFNGQLPVIKLDDEALFSDLKPKLEKIIKAPASLLSVVFLGRKLQDDEFVFWVYERCEEHGMSAFRSGPHMTDMLVLYQDKPMCRLRFVDGSTPRESVLADLSLAQSSRCLTNNGSTCSTSSVSTLRGSTSNGQQACGPAMDAECVHSQASSSPSNLSIFSEARSTLTCNTEKCCHDECGDRPPYANVMPENRKYSVAIEGDPSTCFDLDGMLVYLEDKMLGSPDAKSLIFSICTPLMPFKNGLLVACADSNTSEWVMRVTRPICPPFRCVSFVHFFELERWCFVIPMPNERSWCRIFKVLEKQNVPLDTSQWCVIHEALLDPCSEEYEKKVVSKDFPNKELTVYIDKRSAALISKRCSQLDYLAWRLHFNPCEGIC